MPDIAIATPYALPHRRRPSLHIPGQLHQPPRAHGNIIPRRGEEGARYQRLSQYATLRPSGQYGFGGGVEPGHEEAGPHGADAGGAREALDVEELFAGFAGVELGGGVAHGEDCGAGDYILSDG